MSLPAPATLRRRHPRRSRFAVRVAAACLFVSTATAPGLFDAQAAYEATGPGTQHPRAERTTLVRAGLRDGHVGNLWVAIGRTPSRADLVAAAKRDQVVVLNSWDVEQLRYLKQLNPSTVVLVYQDLSSTRSYATDSSGADDQFLPTGVGYDAADASWFALDTQGNRIEWGKYPGHWQMKVWDENYRATWVHNVVKLVNSQPWDGVFADNDMASLKYYSDARFQGTTSQAQSDALMTEGLDTMVSEASSALGRQGKIFTANVSDARLNLERWRSTATSGGVMDEHFAHWGTSASKGFALDWGRTGWVGQTSELSVPLALVVTTSSATNDQAARFGYASALVRAQGMVAWTAETTGRYDSPEWTKWQSLHIGRPTNRPVRRANGTWFRTFTKGRVIVNPTGRPRTVSIPSPSCSESGRLLGSRVRVPAHDAVFIHPAAIGGRAWFGVDLFLPFRC
jgi:hypothetical protein